jgi:hypothetical protein
MSRDVQCTPPRLTIRLTDEQRRLLTQLIPWGLQDKIFGALVEDLVIILQKASREGQIKMLTQALVSRSIMLSEIGPNFIEIQKAAGLKEK